MLIIGCDFHTRYQQTAKANGETGELLRELRLDHEGGKRGPDVNPSRHRVACGAPLR